MAEIAVKFPENSSSMMKEKGKLGPGEGLNLSPRETSLHLDFDSAMGKCSSVYLAFIFQLPKWGFDRVKVDEKVDVSPVFQSYYQMTMKQKQDLEATIKAELESISHTLSDLELLKHDLRKYMEFMHYFKMVEEGKKNKNEDMRLKGEQSLKSIFIDQVDVHTDLPNTPIALRSIVARWPTIISDFMKLKDEDENHEKISKDYKVSEAEGVVLGTKNRLYKEWRDELFRRAVEDRFNSLIQMVAARQKSYDEYKEMLRPILKRYKSITDGIGTLSSERLAFWRPESQAMSMDFAEIWAWKPFAVPEKYKAPRQAPFDEISLKKAGFTEDMTFDEASLKKKGFTDDMIKQMAKEKIERNTVLKALPIEPSIDNVVKENIKRIEDYYHVNITPMDILKARNGLVDRFEKSVKGMTDFESWIFSPYFFFFRLPIYRFVAHLPDGKEIEDMIIDRFEGLLVTQNIIILRLIELEAKDKQLDNYINQMLGEAGMLKGELVGTDKLKEEYLKFGEEKEKKEEKKNLYFPEVTFFKQFSDAISKFLGFFGISAAFFRARGPYEYAIYDRLTKYYLRETGITFGMVSGYLKSAFGVP